jgi:hypothetical protein
MGFTTVFAQYSKYMKGSIAKGSFNTSIAVAMFDEVSFYLTGAGNLIEIT